MDSRILLMNDMPGYGKVALAAMVPVLTRMGYRVNSIPTALVSNTLNYGAFEILDTTDYLKHTLSVWEKIGFSFDAVATGFIASREQSLFLKDYFRLQSERGVLVFCDPIMADNGKLYNSMTPKHVEDMRGLIQYVDYCVPNYTEAVLLTESEYRKDSLREEEIFELIDALRKLGPKSVVITSAQVNHRDAVAGYDALKETYFVVLYDKIPLGVPGAGDIFLAVLMGKILSGCTLRESVEFTVDRLWKIIDASKDRQDWFKGIVVEDFLEMMTK